MNAFHTHSNFQPCSPAPGAASMHTHADDVANDPNLTKAEKRAILASWISDARAVEIAPSLRRLECGAVVEVDAIRQALAWLDEGVRLGDDRKRRAPPRRERNVAARWFGRVGLPKNANDNDDDPPPAPAGIARPFRPTFIAAHRTRPDRAPVLAYATR